MQRASRVRCRWAVLPRGPAVADVKKDGQVASATAELRERLAKAIDAEGGTNQPLGVRAEGLGWG